MYVRTYVHDDNNLLIECDNILIAVGYSTYGMVSPSGTYVRTPNIILNDNFSHFFASGPKRDIVSTLSREYSTTVTISKQILLSFR